MAYKVFTNGDALTGGELNTYLMNQSVMVFATNTARDAALTTPVEGMLVWLQDSNKYVKYNGSSWTDLLTATSQTISDKSADYALAITDAFSLIRSTGSAITITVNNVLQIGERIDFAQFGTGQITFSAGSGVTLNSADGNLKTAKQYAGATVECVASGVYWLVGNLGA